MSAVPSSCRVLIVDDESTIRSAGSSVLEHLGYTVDTAENGRHGLEMIEAQAGAYNAVLLDLAMPVLDGTTALTIIRQKYPTLPVLLMSGYLSDRVDHLLLLGGPTAVIQKPFSLTDLRDKLAALLAG
ncbi:MAG: cusR 1 [Verrucomicrobiaceae bacterium]|nr:cusR 1 [Verrucomicrobiaceae bacterium]